MKRKSPSILSRLTRKLKIVEREHKTIYDVILDCRQQAVDIPNETLVDIAFILRSMSEYCNDLRKEMDKNREFVEKIACMRWVQDSLNDNTDSPIRGKLATGTPQLRQMASLPSQSKDPINYVKFMKRIGVFGQALKRGLVRTHWPSIVDYITELTEKGKPLPPGIDPSKTYPMYRLLLIVRTPTRPSRRKNFNSTGEK